MIGLSDQDIANYQRDGYLCPLDVLTPEEASEIRAGVEALETDYAGKRSKPVGDYLRMNAHFASDVPLRVAPDARILDRVEGILGPVTPSTGESKDFAMLMRGMDTQGTRINVMPPPGSFTQAQMAFYDQITTAQTEVLTGGLDPNAQLYGGRDAANG